MALSPNELLHRELVQKSQDRIAVHNPTQSAFTFVYDRYRHTVPSRVTDSGFGKGNAIFPRYLANHYIKKMTDAMIMEMADTKVKEENERRKSKGVAEMEVWKDQEVFEGKYRADNESLREEIFEKLFLGLYEEFSGGDIESDLVESEKKDTRTPEEKFAEKYNKRFTPDVQPEPKNDVEKKKNKVISDISA